MTIRVLDPTHEKSAAGLKLAPRHRSLAGQTIGFISNGKEGTKGFFTELEPKAEPAPAVKNMPDSQCLRLDAGSFYCVAGADKYAIEVHAASLLETQQLVAAQYVILMS